MNTNFFEFFLAIVLLTNPNLGDNSAELYDNPLVKKTVKMSNVKTILKTLVINKELLDKREEEYFFKNELDYHNDLHILRTRYKELINAPTLADTNLFPDLSVLNSALLFNMEFTRRLEAKKFLYPDNDAIILHAISQAKRLYEIYDLTRDAKSEVYFVYLRRRALMNLKEKLGPTYYLGLPPVVPIHLLKSID